MTLISTTHSSIQRIFESHVQVKCEICKV